MMLGVRLLRQNLHIYRYSRSLLWISLWSAFRLVTRFGQLPMAFPDAAAPSGNFDDDGPMPVPFGGKPSDLQCYRQKATDGRCFSGHAATALGLIWCVCPLMAGNLALSDLSQMLDYWMEWGLFYSSAFLLFITPADQKTKPAV